jgi:hypothetical protein
LPTLLKSKPISTFASSLSYSSLQPRYNVQRFIFFVDIDRKKKIKKCAVKSTAEYAARRPGLVVACTYKLRLGMSQCKTDVPTGKVVPTIPVNKRIIQVLQLYHHHHPQLFEVLGCLQPSKKVEEKERRRRRGSFYLRRKDNVVSPIHQVRKIYYYDDNENLVLICIDIWDFYESNSKTIVGLIPMQSTREIKGVEKVS